MTGPSDTIPPTPPSSPIPTGQAQLALAASLAVVSQALSQLETAILSYDATAQGIGRALDSAAKVEAK